MLELIFNISQFYKISPFELDHVDYYELFWMFERSQKELEKRANEQNGMQSAESLFGM